MSSLPFTAQQCFYVALIVFVIVGFQRGWKREVITLIFVLLAVVLIRPGDNIIANLLNRLLAALGFIATGSTSSTSTATSSNFLGSMWGTLLAFALIVALGYFVGNRVFPRPANPAERIIGIVPAIISGAFILYYLTSSNFFAKDANGQSFFSIVVQPPDPTRYVPIIFVIALVAVIAGLVMAARAKKPASPAAKK